MFGNAIPIDNQGLIEVANWVWDTVGLTWVRQTQAGMGPATHVIVDSGSITVNNAGGAAAVNIQDGGNSITVDALALPLPAGAATAALQTQPGVDIGDVTVNNGAGVAAVNIQDGGNSITIDAVALPLPAGAATSALQTQPGVDIGDVTVNNAAGAAAVNIQDGGNSITVDGTVTADTELPAASALADADPNPTTSRVGANNLQWNGATWDRVQGAGDNADAVAVAALGRLFALARNYGFNGASWDRLVSGADNADAIAGAALGRLVSSARNFGWNGATWDRLVSGGDAADAVATATLGRLLTDSRLYGFNGATWDRLRSTTTLGLLADISKVASTLHVTATAAVNTAATATLPAAGAGLFHYITRIELIKLYSVLGVAAGAGVIITTTNLPGGPAFTTEQLASVAGTVVQVIDYSYAKPLKSSVANTSTTFVAPLQLQTIWRWNVSYYTGT